MGSSEHARWAPRSFIEDNKSNRMGYCEEGDDFLNSIVTGDNTWVMDETPEIKL